MWKRKWTIGFHIRIYWLAAQPSASEEGLCSMELQLVDVNGIGRRRLYSHCWWNAARVAEIPFHDQLPPGKGSDLTTAYYFLLGQTCRKTERHEGMKLFYVESLTLYGHRFRSVWPLNESVNWSIKFSKPLPVNFAQFLPKWSHLSYLGTSFCVARSS